MKNERGKAALAAILALFVITGLAALATVPLPARADVVDVTTTWNIPVSTAFSVSFPFGNTNITFAPSSATFTDEPAEDQTDAVSSLNITNDGNVNINIHAIFTTDFPSGVTEFRTANSSSGGLPPAASSIFWTDTNETTSNQTIIGNLAPAATFNKWNWSTGSNVVGGFSERTYRLTSIAS